MKSKKQTEPFTLIPNRILNDKKLSLAAKGLLSIMLSNSEGWKIFMSEIYKRSSNGEKSQQGVLKELKKLGYVTQNKTRNPVTRKFEWENIPNLFPVFPSTQNPHVGNAPVENAPVGSEPVASLPVGTGGNNNTNENNSELTNTNLSNTNKEDEIKKEEQEKKAPSSNTICISSEIHTPKKDDETGEVEWYDK